MDMQVSEFTVMATSKCKKNFSCLKGEKGCLCQVTGLNGTHTVTVKPNGNMGCYYMFHLHDSVYCLCPTRDVIYTCYKV